MYAGTSGFSFLQNIVDGSQPIAIFNSLDKSVEFFGGSDIPNLYNKNEIDTLFENIDLSNYYDKTEVYILLTNTNLTGSENIDITNNETSLTYPLKVNGEIVINPRAYGIQFEMYAATSGFAFYKTNKMEHNQ